jgi:hypothetical protein
MQIKNGKSLLFNKFETFKIEDCRLSERDTKDAILESKTKIRD